MPFEKPLVFYVIHSKCDHENENKINEEESIQILEFLGLIALIENI